MGGVPCDVSPDFPPLELGSFSVPSDLELFLSAAAPRMAAVPAPAHTPVPEPAAAAVLEATPPPRNALTLASLAEVFGHEAVLAPNAMVELIQEFQHGGTRYRFVAAREMGTRFKGRLIGPNGDVWADRFELADFPGTHKVVALALGAREDAAPVERDRRPRGAPSAFPGHLTPHPGEVWVMNVVVEEASVEEVRYVGTDIDGRPYGAARAPEEVGLRGGVHAADRGGWRLLVQIDQVQDGHVLYRQLDSQRQPIGAPRKMSAAILVANFVPEAAAY